MPDDSAPDPTPADRAAREEAVFADALAIDDPAARERHVADACADDPALRDAVLALLRASDATSALVDRPAIAPTAPADTLDPALLVGSTVGPYTLREVLGEGGMGVVYRADQAAPLQRTVALKLIKAGLDTREVIARFEAERQALALMDHPNIARVLDAGATDQGRPYFVMELVAGVPITDYADTHRLTADQRVELMLPVCAAVQHAHTKGVIHRDLKPSNVLVTQADGRPVPKVIDFGIAKATDQRASERTLFTRQGVLVGTPAYMSPEQAGHTAVDVDTRTDVYACGVLLYELLTGVTPFDTQRLRSVAFDEMCRILRDEDPPKPSTRLSTLGDGTASVAALRNTEPARLTRHVRGDLDWVVMRTLEKDRARRYQTADALADDLRRYLAGDAVDAGPPGGAYRLRKFVRRHRAGLAVAAALGTLLIAGTTVSTTQWLRASRAEQAASDRAVEAVAERDRAIRAEALAEDRLDDIRLQNDRVQAMIGFWNEDFLGAAIPTGVGATGRDARMGDVVDAAAAQLDDAVQPGGKYHGKPLVEGLLRASLAEVYNAFADYDRAEPLARRAIELLEPAPGRDAANAMLDLAFALERTGQYADAEHWYQRAIDRVTNTHGPNDPYTLTTRESLARVLLVQRKLDRAEPLLNELVATRTRLHGEHHPDTFYVRGLYAGLLSQQARFDEAIPIQQALADDTAETRGPTHTVSTQARFNLAVSLTRADRADEAVDILEEVLRQNQSTWGDDHPQTAMTRNGLASAYDVAGDTDAALREYQAALDAYDARFGRGYPQSFIVLHNLARLAEQRGDHAAAIAYLDRLLEDSRPVYPADDVRIFNPRKRLVSLLIDHGDTADREALIQEELAFRLARADAPGAEPTHIEDAALALLNFPFVADPARAAAYAQRAVDATAGEDWIPLELLGLCHAAADNKPAAADAFRRALAVMPPDEPARTEVQQSLDAVTAD